MKAISNCCLPRNNNAKYSGRVSTVLIRMYAFRPSSVVAISAGHLVTGWRVSHWDCGRRKTVKQSCYWDGWKTWTSWHFIWTSQQPSKLKTTPKCTIILPIKAARLLVFISLHWVIQVQYSPHQLQLSHNPNESLSSAILPWRNYTTKYESQLVVDTMM